MEYLIIHKFYTSSVRKINFNEYLKQKYKELNINDNKNNKNKTKEMYFNKTITSYTNKYNNKSKNKI